MFVADDFTGRSDSSANEMEMGRAHEISKADEKQSRERLKEENVTKEFRGSASHLCHKFFGGSQSFASIAGDFREEGEPRPGNAM